MSALLEQVIEAVRTLPERQLREVLDFIGYLKSKVAHKTSSHPPSGKVLLEVLQREGLIDEWPDLSDEDEPELDSIQYTGKPPSEIIIEDRGPK